MVRGCFCLVVAYYLLSYSAHLGISGSNLVCTVLPWSWSFPFFTVKKQRKGLQNISMLCRIQWKCKPYLFWVLFVSSCVVYSEICAPMNVYEHGDMCLSIAGTVVHYWRFGHWLSDTQLGKKVKRAKWFIVERCAVLA